MKSRCCMTCATRIARLGKCGIDVARRPAVSRTSLCAREGCSCLEFSAHAASSACKVRQRAAGAWQDISYDPQRRECSLPTCYAWARPAHVEAPLPFRSHSRHPADRAPNCRFVGRGPGHMPVRMSTGRSYHPGSVRTSAHPLDSESAQSRHHKSDAGRNRVWNGAGT